MDIQEVDALLLQLEHALDEARRIQAEVLGMFRLILAQSRPGTSQAIEQTILPPQIAFTVKEACAILRVTENTMYDALRRGQIQSVRLGNGYRIPRHVFEAFMVGD